jgi:hypothetical protein
MIQFILDNELKDAGVPLTYDDAEAMAVSVHVWRLTQLSLNLFNWKTDPGIRKNPLPPIILQTIAGVYEILDGKHRVGQAKANGESHIEVYLGKENSLEDNDEVLEDLGGLPDGAKIATFNELNSRKIPLSQVRSDRNYWLFSDFTGVELESGESHWKLIMQELSLEGWMGAFNAGMIRYSGEKGTGNFAFGELTQTIIRIIEALWDRHFFEYVYLDYGPVYASLKYSDYEAANFDLRRTLKEYARISSGYRASNVPLYVPEYLKRKHAYTTDFPPLVRSGFPHPQP